MRRDSLLQSIYDERVSGWWDETLFPVLKDMVAYGADTVQGNTLNEWVDAALDATMATLTRAAPMLAPGVIAARQLIDKPLKHGAETVRQAAHDWAVGQQDEKNRMYYSRRDLTDLDVSAYNNNSAAEAGTHLGS